MKEKVAKYIVWFITVLLAIGCVYMCLCKNWGYALAYIPMVILISPLFQDRLLNKLGSINTFYFDELRIVAFPLGVLLSLLVIIITSTYMSSINILDNTNIDISKCLLKIIIYIFYLSMLWVFKRKDKRNRYIIFGLFYCICVLLSYVSKNFSEMVIYSLNSIFGDGALDEISYQLLIECIVDPIKEAILTFIILDTTIPNIARKNDSNCKIYNICVQNNDNRDKKDYSVMIKEIE